MTSSENLDATAYPRSLSVTLVTRFQKMNKAPGSWVYFGRNYLDMLRWEKRLGADTRIGFGHLMQPAFNKLRTEFIEWTSRLGQSYGDSLHWWITPLASRNTSMTPVFLHICYLEILFRNLLKEIEGEVLIVCEDWFLLLTIEQNLHAAGISLKPTPSRTLQQSCAMIKEWAYGILRWGNALKVNLEALYVARSTRKYATTDASDSAQPHTIVHTCVDEACFGSDGKFHDRFFADLSEWMTGQGLRVSTIPWLFNITRPLKSASRWFRENHQHFLIMEDYVRLSDFPRCIRQIRKSRGVCPGEHTFGIYTITPLIKRERLRNGSSAYNLKFLLYITALKRWKRTGNRCERFIDLFENLAPERPPVRAMKESFPEALTIGYQHSMAPLDLIGYAMTPSEWSAGVYPQRIVTHGPASADFLARQGYPAEQIQPGPAFRYTYLVKEKKIVENQAAPGQSSSVLVLLTLDPEPAAETLRAVLSSRSALDSFGLTVSMKAHPMMAGDRLEREVMEGSLPSGWRWVEGSMHDHLKKSRLVIGLGTGGLMEAAAFGLPVICLGREMDFAYNPLETLGETYEICQTVPPSMLADRLKEILSESDPQGRYQLSKLSSEIINGMGPLDKDHYSAFL